MKTSDRNCLRNRLLYVGQLVDWPEVITEDETLEECREELKDALHKGFIVPSNKQRVGMTYMQSTCVSVTSGRSTVREPSEELRGLRIGEMCHGGSILKACG